MTAQPAPRLTRLLEALLDVGTALDLRSVLQHIVDGAAELTGAARAALEVADPAGGGLAEIRTPGPDPAPGTAPLLRVPIHVGDEEFGELRLARRPGDAPFTVEDEQLLRVLATQAGVSIGNARLYETARQRERWIEGAAAVTTALLTEEGADDALTTVAERARLLAGASAGVILHPTAEGGMAIVTASTPDDPDGIVGATIAPGSPVLEQLLGGEPVFIDDSATDPRMTTHVRHRFGPSMMLPLRAGGRLIGTLALPRRRGGRPYTDLERLLATQFASQAALALVLADARRGRERLAVYEDRDRIARDLHDLVVQRLFAHRPDAGVHPAPAGRRRRPRHPRPCGGRPTTALDGPGGPHAPLRAPAAARGTRRRAAARPSGGPARTAPPPPGCWCGSCSGGRPGGAPTGAGRRAPGTGRRRPAVTGRTWSSWRSGTRRCCRR
ncbi:hypothetical protein STENM327S_09399 [Streptomyces tendae]